jgi:hypothetical protein
MTDFMMGAPRPAFTPPEDAEQPDTITLEWDTSGVCTATIPLDQAREVFGLGGTPDVELAWKVATLAKASPSMLSKLSPYIDAAQNYPVSLRKVDGTPPGEL